MALKQYANIAADAKTNMSRFHFDESSEEQFGHLIARTEIVETQNGHSIVVGASAGAGWGCFLSRFTCLTIKKMTNAIIAKSMTVDMKTP